jgi:hypothetical protein
MIVNYFVLKFEDAEIGISIRHIIGWELTKDFLILRMACGTTYQFESGYFELIEQLKRQAIYV